MQTRHRRFPMHALALAAAGVMLSGTVLAADGSRQAQYQRDVAACKSGTTGQNQADCLREAGAVRTEANPNRHTVPAQQLDRNAQQRCDNLPADQRQTCVETMTSGQTRTHGSVSGGGVLRERTIPIPATGTAQPGGAQPGAMQPPAAPGSAPQPMTPSAPQPMAPSAPQPMQAPGATPQPMAPSAPQPMPAPGSTSNMPAPAGAPTPLPPVAPAPAPMPAPGGPMGAPGASGSNVR